MTTHLAANLEEMFGIVWYCLVFRGVSTSSGLCNRCRTPPEIARCRSPLPKDHLIAELRRSYSPDVKEAAGNSETVPGLCHRTSWCVEALLQPSVPLHSNMLNKSYTSSTAQGGGWSFKNRKPIGEVGCRQSRMEERIHWWTERWLELCFLELLQWLQWQPHQQPLDVVWCSATVVVV